jgi:crotonobetainyl-CoA:carnitine CoA-transferase CaiB-like acyl-CoA transferase
MYLNGEPDRSPVRLGVSASYWHGGAEAAQAALIANHYRRRTGRGQRVDVSLQQCHIWTLLNTTMTWQLVKRQEIRGGARRKERGNNYYSRHLWPCKDGAVHFIPIGGGGGKSRQLSYARLMELMKSEGYYDDFLTARDWNGRDTYVFTQEEYDRVAERIATFLMTKTVAELYELAIREGFLLAPLCTVKDLLESRQLIDRTFFVDVEHPELGTSFTYAGAFAKFSRTPLADPRPAPRLGEHNGDILSGELGFTLHQLSVLRAAGAV